MTTLRKTLAAVGFGLAVAALATPAQAQFSIGIAGGGTSPTGSLSGGPNKGYNGLATVQVGLPLVPFRLRADLQYNGFGGSSFSDALGKAVDGSDSRVISGSINGVWSVLPVGPVQPYVIGGVGYYDTRFSGGSPTRKSGYNYGGGVKVHVPGLTFFAEARVHQVRNGSFDVANNRTTAKFVPINFGIMF